MDIEQMIIENMKDECKRRCELPQRKELLLYLHSMMLITGRSDIMYCNAFLAEATQLLINSIFLYEDGYFDCAFYSIRQASEVFDSMLYLSNGDKEELDKWKAKERFPMDSKIRNRLEEMIYGYKEIKTILGDYFEYHRELINKTHKIIHKQGFDTFYSLRVQHGFEHEEEKLFLETLKYTLGIGIILFTILEPISLALADDDVSGKLNFNFMTEPIDCNYFERFLGLTDIIEKLLSSNYYKGFVAQFENREPMNMATYTVIRDEAWDIDNLDEVEKQIHLLNSYEKYMFQILKLGIKVTSFYYMDGWGYYFTTYKSDYQRTSFGSSEFKKYLKNDKRFNQKCENIYISVLSMYDEKLFFEHNEVLSEDEIYALLELERKTNEEYKELEKQIKILEEVMDRIEK
ncbi:MAG: hypothetical protein J1E35_06055 [Lachnospiraceae bacterium]|nr:hypothetical protein [Lachnospiraceae bacterium]